MNRRVSGKNKGLTITEVTVTVIIIGVLAVALVPRLQEIPLLNFYFAANHVVDDIRYARDYALAHNCWTQVSFNTMLAGGSNAYSVL